MIRAPRSADLLSILESAYADATDEDAWLAHVLEIVCPWVEQGSGVMAMRFLQRDDELWFGEVHARGTLDPVNLTFLKAWREAVLAGWADPELRRIIRPFYPRAPYVSTVNEISKLGPDAMKLLAETLSMTPPDSFEGADQLGIVGGNPSGHGCLIVSQGVRPKFTRRDHALWTQIAAHIAAGYRLVRRDAPVAAVLDPGGEVQHLEPDAVESREAITGAVRAVDRARGKLRRTDPEEAVAPWKALVAGQFTLVDQIDHDGRRFVVAKRNPPEARAWRTLNPRELAVLSYASHGQPHKLIAYELGLSVAAVSQHLASAARKVGAASRMELVAAYRSATESDVVATGSSLRSPWAK